MRNTIHHPRIEVDQLTYEIRKAFGISAEQAEALESVSSAAHGAMSDRLGDSPPDELRHCANQLRGVVLHGFSVLAELQAQAGRLEGLAAARAAIVREYETGRRTE